ncbi:helix-turn-helix domain-containing protein [Porphyrobacter algicida]|uniref:Helix-turn-helix domain-containing protein n=1 Tax=Qipengyuania algicida TaxID=1836209 RepID=A0A845AGK8_9SPHN|nr:AraC family transcriptional regulator [Qipengyuania algicida]MXP29732.1 helix-turn-helix domain-containing protein [Qipengyuania algicida]
MTTVFEGEVPGTAPIPAHSALLVYRLGGGETPATFEIMTGHARNECSGPSHEKRALACFVAHDALARLFEWTPDKADQSPFHLTSELRAIALAILEAPMDGPPRETYRVGKSIELLCETMRALREGWLVPVVPGNALSPADSRRLVAVRRIIDERWADRLTLESLARASGMNRAKLTRGFRALYHCTVTEAISERRLMEARRALRTTDLPVSSIGYASGYLNNASFTRAFGRRFGVSPSEYRGYASAA